MLEKCKYYNDAQTACTLMIDDLVLAAVTMDGIVDPSCDWGYQLNKPNSLYRYINQNLLERYPEIKGTFFIPLKSQHYLDEKSGYKILKGNYNNDFRAFAKEVANHFDFAFHGIKHTYYADDQDSKKLKYEFNHLTLDDIPYLRKEIDSFQELTGIEFKGGKFPGYRGNEFAFEIIEKLGFLWWTSFKGYLNYDQSFCKPRYIGSKHKIIDLPLTFLGDVFNNVLIKNKSKYNFLRQLRAKRKHLLAEKFLQHLYENRLIITIQEHFQNQTTDGRRQGVNIYDDIESVEKIFEILRGADIWHVTTNELAQYLESFDMTSIVNNGNDKFTIKYKGRWEQMFLSFQSSAKELQNQTNGKIYQGIFKNKKWIYNHLEEGTYIILKTKP